MGVIEVNLYGEVGPLRDSDYTSEFIHHTNSSAPEVTRTEHFLETRRRARVPQLFSWRARVASHAKHTRRPGVLGPCTAVNTIEHQRRDRRRSEKVGRRAREREEETRNKDAVVAKNRGLPDNRACCETHGQSLKDTAVFVSGGWTALQRANCTRDEQRSILT